MGTQSRACAKGAFRIYQYQPGVHQENLKSIHDDLQQRAGAFMCGRVSLQMQMLTCGMRVGRCSK